jgi:hypothetical protein
MESNHHSARRLVYSEGSSPVLSVRQEGVADRIRTGAARFTTSGAAVTPQPPRTGTTGLEPAASRLTSERSARLSYIPSSAGGIRTHGLELMRLARTASPLRRKSGRQESNLRSPMPKIGGVAGSPTARCSTPGGARTRSFRVEGPASSPVRPRGRELRRQGSNLRLAVNSRASCRSTTPERAEGEGIEPPRPGGPPVFETGYRACGSPSR